MFIINVFIVYVCICWVIFDIGFLIGGVFVYCCEGSDYLWFLIWWFYDISVFLVVSLFFCVVGYFLYF